MAAGRPTKYNEILADKICDMIAFSDNGLKSICESNKEFPSAKVVYDWIEKYPEFRNKYARARELQADYLADSIISIADDTSNDTLTTDEGREYANSEWINRSRLRIDARKWKASKLYPKKYGERVGVELDVADNFVQITKKIIGGKD
jgi:disulfide oxidoreductase YuzD